MKYPWMPLFWGDFLANTMHLSAQEAGAYLFLIAHAWEHEGRIPFEPVRLARIAHVRQDQWKRVWRALEGFFESEAQGPLINSPTDQWYTHRRVTAELQRLGKISRNRKAAAEQKHSKSELRLVNSSSDASTSTSTSNSESSLGKEARGAFRDKGADYRAPPARKSDNVLTPIPEKSRGKDGH